MLMSEKYQNQYREFLEKYCFKHNVTVEEAEKHLTVIAYKSYLENMEDNK